MRAKRKALKSTGKFKPAKVTVSPVKPDQLIEGDRSEEISRFENKDDQIVSSNTGTAEAQEDRPSD